MPKNEKKIGKNYKYITVQKALESNNISVKIEFLITIKPFFNEFITNFPKGITIGSLMMPKQ